MKEIKFRAWNKETKKMYYSHSEDNEYGDYSMFNMNSTQWDLGFGSHGQIYNGADKSNGILMQFTGVKDRNGVEIYEGDILRILYTDWCSKSIRDKRTLEQYKKDISSIGVVEFHYDRYYINIRGSLMSIFEGNHGEKEVIGNIYQNKELLE